MFHPPVLLRSRHVQTLMGSRGHKPWIRRRARDLVASAESHLITTPEGVALKLLANRSDDAPTVILIHGWLGHADSTHILSAATELRRVGFSVVRLNLRDHGDTAHLNQEMFHSARIQEVIDAVRHVQRKIATGACGLLGFSLGGNFALRVAKATGLPAVAVCPAVDPLATMHAIDSGWFVYRMYFVRKWRDALVAKQVAFPDRYDFRRALKLHTVESLTDTFVNEYTPFTDTADYLSRYDLTGTELNGTRATIVYAEDDPVIPSSGFANLPESLNLVATPYGGHCAFVHHRAEPRWIDRFAAQRLAQDLDSSSPLNALAP